MNSYDKFSLYGLVLLCCIILSTINANPSFAQARKSISPKQNTSIKTDSDAAATMHTKKRQEVIDGKAAKAAEIEKKSGATVPTFKKDMGKPLTSNPIIPVEDFFRNPEKTSYEISPDGTYLSYMGPYKSRMNIFVQKIGETEAVRITSETERDIAGYAWMNNNRLIYIKDAGGDENWHAYGIDKDGKNEKDLTPFEDTSVRFIDDLRDNEEEVIVGLNKRDKRIFDPYRLNINTGEMTQLATNPGNITQWETDHNGVIRVALVSDGVNQQILYRDTDKDEFKVVLETDFKQSVSPLFFTFDNKYLYASSNLNRDKSAIVKLDIANGAKEMEVLFEHPEVDVSSMSYSRKRKVLTNINYTTWKRERHFLDKDRAAMYERLEKELTGYEVSISSYNKAEDKFLIRTYSDRSRGAYYFYDKATDKLDKLVEVSPWLKEDKMAEMKPVQYKSRDGMTIHGYLTLPKGKEAKNLPVIINPHGGPWARDSWGYNPEIQFLANRGYAVLQPNFRGSTGYGKAFWEASFKQWGGTMQDDVTDATNWLIEQGIADPKRIGIYGASYGGYATLMGIVKEPELYACAIDYVGVSNLFTFMGTIPPYWEPYLKMLHEMVGDPANEQDSLEMVKRSPNLNADKIKTPLLVAQGANDPRVKQSESDQMVKALRDRGVQVKYILKENEGHGFRNEENRFEFYKEMEVFLKRWLSLPRG